MFSSNGFYKQNKDMRYVWRIWCVCASFSGFSRQAEKRLEILDAAESTADLAALLGNRFEALSGDRNAQFSIRINQQW